MKYIVISRENKDKLMALRGQFIDKLTHSDFMPIEIKSGEYILPLSVLQDESFKPILEQIKKNGNEHLIVIREVMDDEFIVGEL